MSIYGKKANLIDWNEFDDYEEFINERTENRSDNCPSKEELSRKRSFRAYKNVEKGRGFARDTRKREI